MESSKKSVRAKKFIQDLRAGKTREELMEAHGLSPKGLDKTFQLLLEKQLIDPSEVRILAPRVVPRPAGVRPLPRLSETPHLEEPVDRIAKEPEDGKFSVCPQCGAQVSNRALTCPECGHMLPGEERWERVEPKKTFLDRMSPKTLGILIALPIAVFVIYIFKDIILPMSEATTEKKISALLKEMPAGKSPRGTAQEMARVAQTLTVELEVERLKTTGVISESEPDHSIFFTGPAWEVLPVEERIRVLEGLRAAMLRSSIEPNFQLLDSHHQVVATVTRQSVSLGTGESVQTQDEPVSEPETPPPPPSPHDQIRKLLEPRR